MDYIRHNFEAALLRIDEAKQDYSQQLAKAIQKLLLKNKIEGNKNQNLGELRYAISGDAGKTEEFLRDRLLGKYKEGQDFTLSYEGPDRAKKGEAMSGTYNTHKIVILSPKVKLANYKAEPGDTVYIIDNLKAKSSITNKMLTPDGLGLGGKTYKDLGTLKSDVNSKLEEHVRNETISEPHREFMLDLFDGVTQNVKGVFGDIFDVTAGHTDTITFKSNGIEEHISDPDILKIAKDYGEILGGAYMFKLIGGGGALGLSFPTESNEPLVDFFIDGQSISMKAGGGAAPSLSNVGMLIARDPKKWESLMSTDEQKLMLNVVRTFHENEAAMGCFKVAELINCPGWNLMKQLLQRPKLAAKDIDKKELTAWIRTYFGEKPDEAYEAFDTYFKGLNKFPDGWNDKQTQIEDAIARKDGFGLIMSPLAYHVKDSLNDNTLLVDALGEVVQKFDVLQLYIDLKLNKTKQYQKYTLKKFAEGKFKFNATPSVNLPTRNKFGFKMIKK